MKPSIMRILHVLPALDGGGIETCVLDMVHAMSLEAKASTMYVASRGGSLKKDLEDLGAQVLLAPLHKKSILSFIKNGHLLGHWIREHHIDLVHVHSRAPAWSCFASKLWSHQIPHLSTCHGLYGSSNIFKSFYNSSMIRTDHVMVMSDFMRHELIKKHPHITSRLHTVTQGINGHYFYRPHVPQSDIDYLRKAWNIPQGYKVILLPGRLRRIKGHHILLQAAQYLSPDEKIFFVFLGSQKNTIDYEIEIKKYASKYVPHPVICVPYTQDIRTAYALSDIVISCSLRPETFGRVVAEALSMECIVIGARLGAIPELCIHEETGFLVPPQDPDALRKMILRGLNIEEKQKTHITTMGRQRILEKFSFQAMQKSMVSLYESIMREYERS